jgi:hypothetical protein
MASQSVTNKLVANIKQASYVSKNYFRGTNIVCIDTSNRRIGIDTKTPTWSIDISGVESYNGVKCHNLDISGRADISYALIKDLRAPIISGDDINISNGYFKKIDASLIDISEVIFNSISGDFIYSNNLIKGNTISGNLLDCSSGVIYNNFTICGELFADTYILGEGKKTFEGIVNISGENASLLVDNSASVNFNSINPVQYRTISGNHINTFSISCDNLQVNQQADFSSINVLGEASFNTINVSGDAIFSSISSDSIYINGISLDQFVTNKTTNLYESGSNTQNIDIDTLKGKKLYINSDGNNFDEEEKYDDSSINVIDKLRISEILDLSHNGTSIILPLNKPSRFNKGSIFYSVNTTTGYIDGLTIVKKDGVEFQTTLSDEDKLELKQTNTKSSMYIGTDFSNLNDFSCISIKSNFGSNNDFEPSENPINVSKNKISLNSITEDIIEINATLTVKLINDNNGHDVDAINYEFLILGNREEDNITFNFVKNTNTILVFDNSFNYNTTSLHYIGKHGDLKIPDENIHVGTNSNTNLDISYIFFGISYENTGKNLELVNFNASIKTIV